MTKVRNILMATTGLGFGLVMAGAASAQTAQTYGPELAERAGLTREMVTQSTATVQNGINRLSGSALTSGRLASFSAGNTGYSASTARQRLGIWMNGSYSKIDNDSSQLRTDGNFGTMAFGLDYLVVDGVVIGLAGMYEKGNFNTKYNVGKFDSTGWTIAPYAAFNVMRYLTLSAQVGYTALNKDYDRQSGAIRASYDAHRLYGLGRLALNYPSGNWRFGADLSYLAMNESSDDITESNGARVRGNDIDVNQLSFGVKVGYAFRPEHLGTLTPYMLARIEHDFSADSVTVPSFNAVGQPTGIAGVVSSDATGFVLGGGLDLDFGNFLGGLEGTTLLGKDDIKNHTFMGNMKYRF